MSASDSPEVMAGSRLSETLCHGSYEPPTIYRSGNQGWCPDCDRWMPLTGIKAHPSILDAHTAPAEEATDG